METSLYIVKLVMFFVAFFCGALLLYRYRGRVAHNFFAKNNSMGLKKRDTLYVGYKKYITLVEFEEYLFLVGVGEKDITILHSWKRDGQ